jgi:hypothetical protein
MRTNQGNILQSLRTVQTFLDTHSANLGDINSTGARKKLDDAIAELSDHESEQTGKALAARVETKRKASFRRDLLKKHMAPIARIAQLELPRTDELLPLRMPKGDISTSRLASAAYGMAKAAAPYSTTFVSAGLPADFAEKLTAAADTMITSMNDRSQHQSISNGATKAIQDRLSRGRKIVHVLDTMVTVTLEDDPKLLGAWRSVKRVNGVRRAVKVVDTPTPSAATVSS